MPLFPRYELQLRCFAANGFGGFDYFCQSRGNARSFIHGWRAMPRGELRRELIACLRWSRDERVPSLAPRMAVGT
jgi:hypothetical protein